MIRKKINLFKKWSKMIKYLREILNPLKVQLTKFTVFQKITVSKFYIFLTVITVRQYG
jgi:hypothetical protein